MLTGRAENHIRGVDDLDDTIARLIAYRDAGADVVYAPGSDDSTRSRFVVEAVGVPVNVLALPSGPRRRARVGRRAKGLHRQPARRAAYGALMAGARELQDQGTSLYARGVSREGLRTHSATIARLAPYGRADA